MNVRDTSPPVDPTSLGRRRSRRLVTYLSLALLGLLVPGLAVLLGASEPVPTTPKGAGAETRAPGQNTGPAYQQSEALLTLKAEDIPLLKSLRERQAQLEERDRQLAQREQQLVQREQQLAQREADVRLVQQQIEEKLTTLGMLRKAMDDLLQERAIFEEKRFEHLVKVYELMKPEEISSLFERLNEDTAARLLLQMKEKKAGQILAAISPQVAAKLSERLASQRLQDPQPAATKETR